MTMTAKAEVQTDTLSQNTKLTLPIYLQIVILFSVITFTATAVLGYAKLISNDTDFAREIKELKDSKLDKTTFEKEKEVRETKENERDKKLDAIMKKLKIEYY